MNDNRTLDSLNLPWINGYASSDRGKKRSHNEDRYLLQAWSDNSAVLAVVADGMGGNQAGEVAAQIAIDTFAELLNQPLPQDNRDCYDLLLEQFHKADTIIRQRAGESFEQLGMGTTLAVAVLTPNQYIHLYAGDCRLYQFRRSEAIYMSADHSIVRILQDLGKITPEQVANHPMRSKVSSCLGGRGGTGQFSIDPKWDDENPPIYSLEPGDIVLICSDGLHSLVSNEMLSSILSEVGEISNELLDRLMERALAAGGDDNITIVATQISPVQ